MPMLADFAVRLACGLAIFLLAAPWRIVPPAFFRTHCLIILGLLVLAALDLSRSSVNGRTLALVVGAAALAYGAAVAWGLGLPRLGVPIVVLIVLASVSTLATASRATASGSWVLPVSGRLASACVLGSTLTAMLLGHHYLTAPSMSIEPLRRFVRCMAWSLGARTTLAAFGLWSWSHAAPASAPMVSSFFLAVRWGMGFAGPALATLLVWRTVQIRSTQSATGILYIAMTLVLFGELTALILARNGGMIV